MDVKGLGFPYFLKQGCYVVFVDINPDAKLNITNGLKNEELDNFDFINLDGGTECINYNCNFEIIFCLEVLERIQNYLKVIKEFKGLM